MFKCEQVVEPARFISPVDGKIDVTEQAVVKAARRADATFQLGSRFQILIEKI